MRVVQLSDLHLRPRLPGAEQAAERTREWIRAGPPDLVVLTGDLVYEDPDDADDRSAAVGFARSLDCRVEVIPGNHDVGFFDPPDRRTARLAAFRSAWGSDRFVVDAEGWRLIGANTYTIGDAEADAWLGDALDTSAPVALFLHHPVVGEPIDGWQAPEPVNQRLAQMVGPRDVRLVATGHRHCAVVRESPGGDVAADAVHVWAPSMTLSGPHPYHGGDQRPGAVEYDFTDGAVEHRFVHPGEV